MDIHFVTGSKNKFEEARQIMPCLVQLDIDLPEIQEIDAHKIIVAKLQEARKHHKGRMIVEDTSLYLDCMHGLPGPLIKWFIVTIGVEGLYDIAAKYKNFSACARTIVGYMNNSGHVQFFEGVVYGRLVFPCGIEGFAWDQIFVPDGYEHTFAEMTKKEKNAISMRKIAIEKLKNFYESKE